MVPSPRGGNVVSAKMVPSPRGGNIISTKMVPSPRGGNVASAKMVPSPRGGNVISAKMVPSPRGGNVVSVKMVPSPQGGNVISAKMIPSPPEGEEEISSKKDAKRIGFASFYSFITVSIFRMRPSYLARFTAEPRKSSLYWSRVNESSPSLSNRHLPRGGGPSG